MLAKQNRLNLSRNFKFVSAGKRIETPSFKLMFRMGENNHPLVGIALTKKNFRKANLRNKVKRKTAKAIESIYGSLPNQINLVIMPKIKALESSDDDLIKELTNAKISG